MDGEPLHFSAVNKILGEEQKSISLEKYKPYMGTKTGWSDMLADYKLSKSQSYYADRYREIMLSSYREQAEALPGAVDAVRDTSAAGVRVAVASSSIAPWVGACLERLGLTGAFDAVVTGSDVKEGKPDPEIYLLAASTLGVSPGDCLAIEDAPAGIESAHRAGMTCWAVRTAYTQGLALPNPELELQSLLEYDVRLVAGVAA